MSGQDLGHHAQVTTTTKTPPTLDAATAAVRACIGYVEQGGPDGKSGNITKWGKRLGIDGQPWCAAGLTCVLHDVGVNVPLTGSTRALRSWAIAEGRWDDKPTAGAIALFDFNRGDGVPDHAEFVVTFTDSHLITVGFNTQPTDAGDQTNGGGVYAKKRSRSYRVLGYVRLTYALAAIPTPRPAPAPSPAPAATAPARHGTTKTVKVKKGQTLGVIAAGLGVTVGALLAVNPSLATHPDRIFPGDTVNVPEVKAAAPVAPAPAKTTAPAPAPAAPAPAPAPAYQKPVAPMPIPEVGREIGRGSSGADVAAVQARLQALGYDLGPRGVDSLVGGYTVRAIKKFQTQQGLNPDAVAGRDTVRALGLTWTGKKH